MVKGLIGCGRSDRREKPVVEERVCQRGGGSEGEGCSEDGWVRWRVECECIERV